MYEQTVISYRKIVALVCLKWPLLNHEEKHRMFTGKIAVSRNI
jgi:hypothetical protein